MARQKYYFRDDDADCYTLDAHIEYMVENHIEQMEVTEARAEQGAEYFFCKHFSEVGEKNQHTCGKMCEHYTPRNHKSGICKHHGRVYEATDKKQTLRVELI